MKALAAECRSIDTRHGRVAYYVARPGLVHSINAAASACEVRPLFEHYVTRRPAYAIDLPGYGASDRAARDYTPRVMTDAVLALVAAIEARYPGRTIDGIAVSLSSGYLARAAVEEPRRFRTICLVSATGLDRMKRFDGPPGSTRGKSWLLKELGRARCAVPPADSSPGPPFLPREDLG